MSPRTVDAELEPRCRACGARASPLLRALDLNRRVSSQDFAYLRCPHCGLVFLDAAPADLGRYYEESYHMIPRSLDALARSAEAHERYKLALLRSVKAAGRVIEIGPGSGGFALLARQAGYDVTVIDMSASACRFIADEVKVRAVHATDEAESLAAEPPADVIALWHVIEHLREPFRLLEVAATRLTPTGVLLVATPNPLALQFRLLGRRWTHLDAPRHLQLIPAEVMTARARASGLAPLWLTYTDPGSLAWNRFGWDRAVGSAGSGEVPSLAARAFGKAMALLCAPLERHAGLGSAYTAAYAAAPA